MLTNYALMAEYNGVACNGACRCTAIVWAIILAPRHRSFGLDWWSGARWCVQWVPGHQSAVETGRWGAGRWPWWWLGRHAPLDWNSYCVSQLVQNTLLFLLVFLFFHYKVLPQHSGCHVLPCISRNTGQINPAGIPSLKYMYYIHVIWWRNGFDLTW